jgi:excisionase family DNA binding protein
MEALDKPYRTTKTTTFVCGETDLTPVSAEEVVIGGLRQIMEAVKKLQSIKPEPKPAGYSLAQAAKYLGMTQRKLREAVKNRRIACIRIAYRNFLFTEADLNEFLATYRTKPRRI